MSLQTLLAGKHSAIWFGQDSLHWIYFFGRGTGSRIAILQYMEIDSGSSIALFSGSWRTAQDPTRNPIRWLESRDFFSSKGQGKEGNLAPMPSMSSIALWVYFEKKLYRSRSRSLINWHSDFLQIINCAHIMGEIETSSRCRTHFCGPLTLPDVASFSLSSCVWLLCQYSSSYVSIQKHWSSNLTVGKIVRDSHPSVFWLRPRLFWLMIMYQTLLI